MAHNETVFAFPTALLNDKLLATKFTQKKKLRGFGFEKALKCPWKYSLETVEEEAGDFVEFKKVSKLALFANIFILSSN